ncbi:hypothetical protein EDB86DRAFT_2956121 [Lactarius hatsudake]|nr:hypothetical protein EDB86DRAFT_2956121 [Lactarius hatsudake]
MKMAPFVIRYSVLGVFQQSAAVVTPIQFNTSTLASTMMRTTWLLPHVPPVGWGVLVTVVLMVEASPYNPICLASASVL